MKKSLPLLVILFIIQYGFSQCTVRTATFQSGLHNVSGTAILEFHPNGDKILSFDNFYADSGPDVNVYLSNSIDEVYEDINISDLSYASTSQYNIPPFLAITDIDDYQYIVIWCSLADVLWGYGTLSASSASSCNPPLSIEDNTLNNFSIHPNPASNTIHITGIEENSAEIRIFDILGKPVYKQIKNINEDINISHLDSGIYLLNISIDGKTSGKKLVIQ